MQGILEIGISWIVRFSTRCVQPSGLIDATVGRSHRTVRTRAPLKKITWRKKLCPILCHTGWIVAV